MEEDSEEEMKMKKMKVKIKKSLNSKSKIKKDIFFPMQKKEQCPFCLDYYGG